MVPVLGAVKPMMIVGAVLFMLWISRGDKTGVADPKIRAMIAFIFVCAVSVTWSKNTFWVFKTFEALIVMLLGGVLPLTSFADSIEKLRKFFLFWIFCHVVLALYGIFITGGIGPGSFVGDENDFALVLNMAVPYALMARGSLTKSKIGALLCLASGGVMIVGGMVTLSRGGMIGLAAVLVGIIVLGQHRARNIITIAVLMPVLFFFAPDKFMSEAQSITNKDDNTRVERLYSWGLGWKMFVDNPVLGVGANNYPWTVDDYEVNQGADSIIGKSIGGRAAHSLYFTLLPELGTVGVLLYGTMAVLSVTALRRIVRELGKRTDADAKLVTELARAVGVSIFAFLLCGAFISVLYYPNFYYCVAMTVLLQIHAVRLARTSEAEPAARNK